LGEISFSQRAQSPQSKAGLKSALRLTGFFATLASLREKNRSDKAFFIKVLTAVFKKNDFLLKKLLTKARIKGKSLFFKRRGGR